MGLVQGHTLGQTQISRGSFLYTLHNSVLNHMPLLCALGTWIVCPEINSLLDLEHIVNSPRAGLDFKA